MYVSSVLFSAILVFSSTTAEDPNCPWNPLYLSYESLQCQPVWEKGSRCPTSYNCTEYENQDPSLCHVRGKSYKVSEDIQDVPLCMTDCFCQQTGNHPSPNCTYTDCPYSVSSGCRYIKREDECCSTLICGDRDTPNVTCQYDGLSFAGGDVFTPSDKPCITCTCKHGFRGVLEEPFCKHEECHLQLYHSEELTKGCAPVFLGSAQCCPLGWRCPEQTDTIVRNFVKTNPSSAKCKFGELVLEAGESIYQSQDSQYPRMECSCQTPPFLTCIAEAIE